MYDEENAHIAQQNNEGGSHMATHNAEAHNGPANVENAQAIIAEINETLLKAFKLAIKSYGERHNMAFCFVSDESVPGESELSAETPFNAGFETVKCFMQGNGDMVMHGNLTGKLAAAFPNHNSSLTFKAYIDDDGEQKDSVYCQDTSLISNVNVEALYYGISKTDLVVVLKNVKQVWYEVCEAYAEKP